MLAHVFHGLTGLSGLCVHMLSVNPLPAEPASQFGGGCCFGRACHVAVQILIFLKFSLPLWACYVWVVLALRPVAALVPLLLIALL